MKNKPLLSIVTPSVPERLQRLGELADRIEPQLTAEVEWLVHIDNRLRSIGEKRDNLVQSCKGEYVAFVDDDDAVSADYVESILAAIKQQKTDVVTFCQLVIYNGMSGSVRFRLGAPNAAFKHGEEITRNAWHVCAFRATIAKAHHFPHVNYGEDWAWARHVAADCATEFHIDKVLHTYRHDEKTTLAPPPQ